MWLPQYIVDPAPCVNRREPLFVVDQWLKIRVPAFARVVSGNRITDARCPPPRC